MFDKTHTCMYAIAEEFQLSGNASKLTVFSATNQQMSDTGSAAPNTFHSHRQERQDVGHRSLLAMSAVFRLQRCVVASLASVGYRDCLLLLLKEVITTRMSTSVTARNAVSDVSADVRCPLVERRQLPPGCN